MAFNLFKSFAVLLLLTPLVFASDTPPFSPVHITASDRILILSPHPDDEVLGTGGVIQMALAAGASVHIAFLTMGDNYEWAFMAYRHHPVLSPVEMRQMGEVRRNEALTADQILGVPADHLTFLGYPDWGTLPIWTSYWGDVRPFRSMLTRVRAVPYPEALRPGADYLGQDIIQDLETVIQKVKPTKIFVSHSADEHRDHRALYLYMRVALWNLKLNPDLFPFIIHFKNWPEPRKAGSNSPITPPAAVLDQGQWQQYVLTPDQQTRKEAALHAHATQFRFDHRFLSNFLRENEVFGEFPDVEVKSGAQPKDLSAGPHQDAKLAAPEELSDEKQDQFVGIDWRTLERQGDDLIITLSLSRKLRIDAHASLSIFGWRPDQDFSVMPKLQVRFGHFGHTVYDQKKRLKGSLVTVTEQHNVWRVTVPLTVLNHPTRLLMGARTALGRVDKTESAQAVTDKQDTHLDSPLDWTGWRSVVLD